ncbi:DUF2269 family protein [Variovorax sp. MHTC-1]|uniref:DUF2269 family protein n=1 Tax=Variovorax sp. MHTC-1 TaxID=2495593 RepID=UPI000F87C7CA|nr:DUF2269 domain-containing protein [Variovorax sp. MHTC-1]RST53298.1 DUF2269 domain-containing protein [Variovorax sp. MHTC-1]
MEYLIVKWLHVISSTVLFGTGVGSAFYLLATTLSRDVRAVAVVARMVVRADWLFTATSAVLQPLTGFWLMHLAGLPLQTPWVKMSIFFYVLAILCWLPVVWLQIRLRDLASEAASRGQALPARYWMFFKWWVVLGVPAFFLFLALFWLMVAKPAGLA